MYCYLNHKNIKQKPLKFQRLYILKIKYTYYYRTLTNQKSSCFLIKSAFLTLTSTSSPSVI